MCILHCNAPLVHAVSKVLPWRVLQAGRSLPDMLM